MISRKEYNRKYSQDSKMVKRQVSQKESKKAHLEIFMDVESNGQDQGEIL